MSLLARLSQQGDSIAAHNADAAAHGSGSYTVAQINAFTPATRPVVPIYCSDCLTVNGPGSLVAWCGRTSTWRTLDDCLLATADFTAWVIDFVQNSNSSELRGNSGSLFNTLNTQWNVTQSTANGGGYLISAESGRVSLGQRLASGSTNVLGLSRLFAPPQAYYTIGAKPKVFAGIKKDLLAQITTGFTFRVGLATAVAPMNALATTEYSVCYDRGNVLGGLNAGAVAQWLACFRSSSVNLTGSGAVGVGPSTSVESDVIIIRNGDAVSVVIGGTTVATGTATEGDMTGIVPFCALSNDGTSTVGALERNRGFVFGSLF